MPNAKVQVVLPATTGLPADVFINTFHFATSANSTAVGADIVNRLVQFYNTLQAGTGDSVALYLGNAIDRTANACSIRCYDETPNSLPPFYEESWTLGGGQALADLPWEVACCLSFKNTSVTTSPERNRRGRIYVGPLTISAQTESGGSIRPAADFMNTLLEAGDALELSNNAMATWVVWSQVLGLSFPVEAGWVDNAFDTQRRRGEAATARLSLTF